MPSTDRISDVTLNTRKCKYNDIGALYTILHVIVKDTKYV